MKKIPSFPDASLYQWYLQNKRDLPWRESSDPYRVWISEIMLQQTQVDTVIPYYQRFLKRFPNVASLARAQEEKVLSLWSGLGYYSRARNLHAAARMIVKDFEGKFPDTYEGLLALPGIGPYTAGAIISIAFNKPQPILDGNVRRVLSRFYANGSEKELWKSSKFIVEEADKKGIPPCDFNQALMELGALVCAPDKPGCDPCPLRKNCLACLKGQQSLFPKKSKSPKTVRKFFALALLEKGPAYFVLQRSAKQRWFKNMWEFPMIPISQALKSNATGSHKVLSSRLSRKIGAQVQILSDLGEVRHSITRHDLRIRVVRGTVLSRANSGIWAKKSDLTRLSSSSILKKALALSERKRIEGLALVEPN